MDKYGSKAADNSRMETSKLLITPTNATYNLIKFPKFAFVTDIWVQKVVISVGDSEVEVGWFGNGETADTDGFLSNATFAPTVLGLVKGTLVGKWFLNAAGGLTAKTTVGTGTMGNFRVIVRFTIIHP
jgi:hypothetical protein